MEPAEVTLDRPARGIGWLLLAAFLLAIPIWVQAAQIGLADVVRFAPWVLLGALAIPCAIAIAARPQRGVLLLAAFVPFNGLLLIAPAHPGFIEAWKEMLATYTVVWAVFSTWRVPRPERKYPRYAAPLLAYFAVGLVSAAFVGGVTGLVGLKIGYFWAFAAIAVWRTPLTARDRDHLVTILMLDGVITAVYGLGQQVMGADRLHALGYAYDSVVRFTGAYVRSFSSFHNPFEFAFFLTLVLVMGVPIALADPARPRNVAFLAITPVLGLALAFSFVRGAWLALGAGMIYLALRRFRVLLLPVPFAVLGLLLLPGSFSSSAFGSSSFQDRQIGWDQNLSKVISAPLGNGIGTTGASAEKVAKLDNDVTKQVFTPDNQYFKVLYELGVAGLWFFVLMWIAVVVTANRNEALVPPPDEPFAMGVTAYALGAIVASFVATWLEIFPADTYFWMLMAIVVTTTYEQRAQTRTLPDAVHV